MDHQSGRSGADRTQSHRDRAALQGLKRVEVKVNIHDEWIIRGIAQLLNKSEAADQVREDISKLLPNSPGINIVDFFQKSPLMDDEFKIDRSKDTGSPLSF